jgi:hypothetical protein
MLRTLRKAGYTGLAVLFFIPGATKSTCNFAGFPTNTCNLLRPAMV